MKRLPPTLLAAALALGASAALAAESKCEAEASVCIRQMADQIARKGWIGVEFESASKPIISRVVAGSPAEAAGVRVGDRWVGLNDERFTDLGDKKAMQRVKSLLVPGAELVMHVLRDGNPVALPIEAGRVPKHILAQWVGQHVLEYHMAPVGEDVVAEQEADTSDDGD